MQNILKKSINFVNNQIIIEISPLEGDEATVVVDDSTTATNRLSKARGSVEHSGGNPLSPLSSPPPMKAQKHYLTGMFVN